VDPSAAADLTAPAAWTLADLPAQDGRTIVVTGATSGLGAATAVALAARGAHVVLAARDADKARATMAAIRERHPAASVSHLPLDLADLRSVREASARLRDEHSHVDVIVANAGIMATPLTRTVDGFELQLAVNHLGHAAFVAGALPALQAAQAGRVVAVSSTAHRMGSIDLDDLDWRRTTYRRWAAYGRSKLANLLYVLELQRRFDAAGSPLLAVAAHPGYTRTALQTTGVALGGGLRGTVNGALSGALTAVVGQPVARGVLPQLFAATGDVPGASYWGPDGPAESRGHHPAPATRSAAALDTEVARRLLDLTDELTGVPHALDAAGERR
jgi:NAD(P)-dependent dehydrogenase (short-subunit alcohol dehydrogenase family)